MLWGHPISGLSTVQLLEAERSGARCSGIRPAGKCRFITNCVVYGPCAHPVARVLKETFKLWFATLSKVVATMPSFFPQVRDAWIKTRDAMSKTLVSNGGDDFSLVYFKHSCLDKHVHRLLTNIISLFFRLGWNPRYLDIWFNPEGDEFLMGAAKDCLAPLLYEIIDSYNVLQYERASKHFDGKGIHLGVEWSSTFSLVYTMRKSRDTYVVCLLAALETVTVGAAWPQARVGDIFSDVSQSCPLCGELLCDSLHVFWNCPCINSIQDDAMSNSNHLAPIANEEGREYPCYWLRGLMPKPFAQIPEDNAGYLDRYHCSYYLTAPASGQWPSGDYFGDASGGRYNLFPTLRRVGLGLVCMNGSTCMFGLKSYLMGKVQTVHRGEAAIVLVLIGHLADNSVVNYYGDNENFVDCFNKGYEHCRQTLNADIYQDIFLLLSRKNISFAPYWMPSHLLDDPDRRRKKSKDPKPVPAWVEHWHKVGNNNADILASEACKRFDVSAELADPIINRIKQLKLIQNRLASIIRHLPERPRVPRPPRAPRRRVTLDEIFHTSSHVFLPANSSLGWLSKFGRLSCASCHASCSTKSAGFRAFLAGSRTPCRVQEDRHRILGGVISMNGAVSHPSHTLHIVGKCFVCSGCGYKASQKLHNLKSECVPRRRTDHGNAVLKAVEDGTLN